MKVKHFLIGLVLLMGLVWGAVLQLPDDQLHLVFCHVGQGDAALISYRTTQILIDGGPAAGGVLECLSQNLPFYDREIEMMVLTHPEADHFTGLIDVIERYNVKQFVINGLAKDTSGFWSFREGVLAEGAPIYSPKAGDQLKVGPLVFSVLWPRDKLGSELVWQSPTITDKTQVLGVATVTGELNDTSIVLKLSFGDFDALLTGDISTEIEQEMGKGVYTEPVEVLKIAHHGSKYSTSSEFLGKLKPALAVISVGKNSFGHPTKEVLTRLRDNEIAILRTDKKGEIEIVSDGKSWQITK